MPDAATLSFQFFAGSSPLAYGLSYTTRGLVSVDTDGLADLYLNDRHGPGVRLITVDQDLSVYPGTTAWTRDWDEPRVVITRDGGDNYPTLFFTADFADGHVVQVLSFAPRVDWDTRLVGITPDNDLVIVRYGIDGGSDLYQYSAAGNLVWSATQGDHFSLTMTPDGHYGILRQASYGPNGEGIVFTGFSRLDLTTHQQIDLLSLPDGGAYNAMPAGYQYISDNGRLFLFTSDADNIVPGDNNGTYDVFVRDILTGETILVSATAEGGTGDGASGANATNSELPFAADGRTIYFHSEASNLAAPATDFEAGLYQFTLPERFWQPVAPGALLSFTATTTAQSLSFNSGDNGNWIALPAQNGRVVYGHRYAADGDYDLAARTVDPSLTETTSHFHVMVRAYATQAQVVRGGGAADILMLSAFGDIGSGGAGDDQLFGGMGNDSLDGGSGADFMVGGYGDDVYGVENRNDIVSELDDAGTDTVKTNLDGYVLGANVENLTLTGSGNISGTGNDLNNVMIGNGGNNTLNSGKGDDQLYGGAGDDILNSGTGADRMYGGAGNDIYYYGVGDTIIEAADAGIDTVYASVNFTIGSTLENLVLIGDRAINGTGNNLGNRMQGNDQANVLQGGRGNDALYGQGGDDILVGGRDADTLGGGSGADTFRFDVMTDSLVAGADTIIDYNAADGDRLDLSRLDADTTTAGDQAFHQVAAFTHHAGELTFSFDAGTNRTTLSLDMNGDGNADMAILFVGNVNSTGGWLL